MYKLRIYTSDDILAQRFGNENHLLSSWSVVSESARIFSARYLITRYRADAGDGSKQRKVKVGWREGWLVGSGNSEIEKVPSRHVNIVLSSGLVYPAWSR